MPWSSRPTTLSASARSKKKRTLMIMPPLNVVTVATRMSPCAPLLRPRAPPKEGHHVIARIDELLRLLIEVDGLGTVFDHCANARTPSIGAAAGPRGVLDPLHVLGARLFEQRERSLKAIVFRGLIEPPHDLHVLERHRLLSISETMSDRYAPGA